MHQDKIFVTVNSKLMSLATFMKMDRFAATDVWVDNCPGLAALPDLPAATFVRVDNCPGLAVLPDLPAAKVVWINNCPGLAALPDLPAATNVRVNNCPGLAALPNLPAATVVRVADCPGLAELPDLPAATFVRVNNCPGLALVEGGMDSRGYNFFGVKLRGQWRICAGCRTLSLTDARRHWGDGGASDRKDCLRLVEKIADEIGRRDRSSGAEQQKPTQSPPNFF